MAIDLSTLGTYTPEQRLTAIDAAIIANLVTGTFWAINGTQVTREPIQKLYDLKQATLMEIAIRDNGYSGNTVLVQFGER